MRIKLSIRFSVTTENVCLFILKLYFRSTDVVYITMKIKLNVYRYVDNIPSPPFVLLKKKKTCKSISNEKGLLIISVRFRPKVSIPKNCIKKRRQKHKYLLVFVRVTFAHNPTSTICNINIIYGPSERQHCWRTHTHHFEDVGRLFLSDGRRMDQTKSQPNYNHNFSVWRPYRQWTV